ncbi:MAG: hypothetical protein Kow00123_18070 [Anaerolineales bacterium]
MTYSPILPQRQDQVFPRPRSKWAADSGETSAPGRFTSCPIWPDSSVALHDTTVLDAWRAVEVGASTVCNAEFQVHLISKMYDLAGQQEVLHFLDTYPFLVPLLLEAYAKITQVFGPACAVTLKVVTDPEAPDDRELFALVRTTLPPSEALRKLDELDQGWWLDKADEARGKLCIHVEFQ